MLLVVKNKLNLIYENLKAVKAIETLWGYKSETDS